MCELFAMSSQVPTNVRFSLTAFARHGGATAPHRDGWGIAFYEGKDARLLREASPASESALVRFVGEHDFPSSLVISHIRRATRGAPAIRNTHPFQRELGGRVHVFAHNGELPGIESHRGFALGPNHPVGETGSEWAFCALLARLKPLWSAERAPSLTDRLEVVSSFAALLRELGPANFLYADGEVLFVHSHQRRHREGGRFEPPGLHTLTRECPCLQHQLECVSLGDCCEPQRVFLAASVPLSDEVWEVVPEGTVLAVAGGRVVARAKATEGRSSAVGGVELPGDE